jgi:hypothetical protein
MSNVATIKTKLPGPPEAKERRARLIAELWQAFADSGPQAVTGELRRRLDALASEFTARLQELKNQL